MQIKEVVARYRKSAHFEFGYHRGYISLWSILKCMEYHENIIGFTSIVFTSSMDIVSTTHELSKDYIEKLRNSSYLKIRFIMVKIVCMSAEFNRNGEFKNF